MSTRMPSRQAPRSNRRRAHRDLDLNTLPPEAMHSVSVDLPHGQIPIDIEAMDDEVMMLPSSNGFPQARSRHGRKHSLVVIDEGPEIHAVNVMATVSLNNRNKRERIPESRTIIDCEDYSTSQDDRNAKRKKVLTSSPEPVKVVPKEPGFSCPVCMSELSEACSTICGHIFCQNCIKLSVQKLKKCPTCRKPLTMKNFHRVYLPAGI